jgi:hypothetical protein
MSPRFPFLAAFLAASFLAVDARAGSGDAAWLPTTGSAPDFFGFLLNDPWSMTVFDDGQGPTLFVTGSYTSVGDVPIDGIAKWDGSTWSPFVNGLGFFVSLHALDDGTGDVLYATASNNVWRWSGSAWLQLGIGFDSTPGSLVMFDDGSGVALHAGGSFETADGVSARHIAKWTGTSWVPLGIGLNDDVFDVVVYDDGSGDALYVGGSFNAAGGNTAPRVARWDGTSWSSLASGVNGQVRALTVFDDGNGPGLYAAGDFTHASGLEVNHVSRWDGTSWSALGVGLPIQGPIGVLLYTLSVFDDGNGDELYVSGRFPSAGGLPASGIAKWNGTSWSALPLPPYGVQPWLSVFEEFDDGTGAGMFTVEGGLLTRWRDGAWGVPGGDGPQAAVRDVVEFDDGLCAVGDFRIAGGRTMSHAARWDGSGWSPLGSGLDGVGHDAEVFAGDLYVAGDFTDAGGTAASGIARWDGSAWSDVGGGLDNTTSTMLTLFDDGSGLALYAGGAFRFAGGVFVDRIAKWDGTTWSDLSGGMNSSVTGMTVYDDGSGSALYASGFFTDAGGVPAVNLARWDGTQWSSLGAAPPFVPTVIKGWDDGSGPRLYAGVSTLNRGLISWSGGVWSPTDVLQGDIFALEVFDDGSGESLFVGGTFPFAAGVIGANSLLRYDGTTWSALGNGPGDPADVFALTAIADPPVGSAALFVGGEFDQVDTGDSNLSRWGVPLDPPVAYCFGDGTGTACPCGNTSAPGHGCDIPAGTGGIVMSLERWAPDFSGGGEVDFSGMGFPPMSSALSQLIRSSAPQAPATVFGDGLLCVAPAGVVRISAVLSSGGVAVNPAMHGAGAGTFYYQLWVRSQPIMFCDPNAAYNLSNGIELSWP